MGANDAAEMLEVAKAEVARLEAHNERLVAERHAAFDDRDAALERLGQLSRLHEVATERTVGLAAVIENAKAATRRGNIITPSWVLEALDVDTDAALREVREAAWQEGAEAARAEDFMAEGFVETPNPYRKETTRGPVD